MPAGRPIRPIPKIRGAISSPERFETAADYLLHTINDPMVAVGVKVRAAAALLAHESPGKRVEADRAARTATEGSVWERILPPIDEKPN